MYFHSEASWSAPRSVRAPQTTRPCTGNGRRQLIAARVQLAVLAVCQCCTVRAPTPISAASSTGRRLPDAALGVGAGVDAGDGAARRERLGSVLPQRVRRPGLAGSRSRHSRLGDTTFPRPGATSEGFSQAAGRVDDDHRATIVGVFRGRVPGDLADVQRPESAGGCTGG